jgi:hypothetical protein
MTQIIDNMDVTVEAGAFDNDAHKGERARVYKVIRGIFAVIVLDGSDEMRGCIVDCLQPRMTAHNAEITANAEGAAA